ncbi:MAG TPA: hypothetical protein VG010_06390 [Solirubrobacteraceae bacterium]|jgi:hypothetical protein|nr:hypothetical protein [Solirubrobacteraceae bacterium]
MADWSTIASTATAAGTLVLAVATFSSVRASQRSARLAERSTQLSERSLLLGLRPVLAPARVTDPPERVRFGDRRMVNVGGGLASVERDGENFYFVIPLRNVGNGLAVLRAWRLQATVGEQRPALDATHADPADHRPQTRDLYVPAGDTGFWQGAIREPDDPFRENLSEAYEAGELLTVDLLYGDHEGGQLTISRFILSREEDGHWRPGVVRHWALEASDPRGR